MHHTIPQFMNRIINRLGVKTSADSSRVVFHYFAQCAAGKSSTLWNVVVNEHAKNDALKTFENWQSASGSALKNQNMSCIEDAVNDKILCIKRPVKVSFIDYIC